MASLSGAKKKCGRGSPHYGEPFHARFRIRQGRLRTPCWIWIRMRDKHGYGTIMFRGHLERAHRVSWLLHRGPIPGRLFVLHDCDTPACVNPKHLHLGTQRDNMREAKARGRTRNDPHHGERSSQAKTTDAEALRLRKLHAQGVTCAELGRKFGISNNTAWKIAHGFSRPHLPGALACRH